MEEKKETKWSQVEEYLAAQVIDQAKRATKRWFIAWLITMAILFVTNGIWIYVFNSYEYVYQDGTGENYYNNEIDGDVGNGTAN